MTELSSPADEGAPAGQVVADQAGAHQAETHEAGADWLSDSEQRAWRKLAAVMTLLPAALDTQLQRDADLTHFAYFVLAMLSEAPGRSLRMSVLAARSSSSPSRLSHTVSRLEQRGLVHRRRADEDGRGQIAALTAEGLATLIRAAPGHVHEVRRLVFDGMDAIAVKDLEQACARVLATLDPEGSWSADDPPPS